MLAVENKLNSLQLFYIFAVWELVRACLHGGGGPPVRSGNPPVHVMSQFNLLTFT